MAQSTSGGGSAKPQVSRVSLSEGDRVGVRVKSIIKILNRGVVFDWLWHCYDMLRPLPLLCYRNDDQ